MTFVITRTPYRISFFGGGSDYPEWYLKNGGAVLSSSLNKYVYITVRHLPKIGGVLHRIVWRHVETVETVHDILHPAVREGMKFLKFDDSTGLEITYQGDLPARSGMGSSSTFAVGLINALRTVRGEQPSAHSLTREAIHLERNLLHDKVGSQDQTAAAYGGLNYIEFGTDGEIKVKPVNLPKPFFDKLNDHLLLFFTGRQRTASSVADAVIRNLNDRQVQIRRMQAMAAEGVGVLESGDIDSFGRLLHEAWTLKRGISDQVSTEFIDRVYSIGRENGALGGKLLGAGQAGFMCFIVPPDRQAQVISKLDDIGTFVPVRLDTAGSQVIYSTGIGGDA
jgi:D-glycero-alpha-D-manno-heptose-7-phosphate kinase